MKLEKIGHFPEKAGKDYINLKAAEAHCVT